MEEATLSQRSSVSNLARRFRDQGGFKCFSVVARCSDNSLTFSSPHTQCSWENACEGGEAWDQLQVLYPSFLWCHTARSPSLAGRRTTGQKAVAAPCHRLRVTIHRGVALADPDYLPDSEAGGGCSSWCCGDASTGTCSECQVICTERRALNRAYPLFIASGDGSIAHCGGYCNGPKGWSELPAAASSLVQAILAFCQGVSAQFLGKCSQG
jgi:hypothetical protein